MAVPSASALERHPHLADRRRPGTVRVDLHSHTMWSGDSTSTPEEIERAVREAALDVVCITDHNSINGALQLRDRLPCRVVVGEEVRTTRGELIGLFLTDRVPIGLPPLEAAARIRAQGGVVYVPHPFDPMRHNMAESALRDLAAHGLLDAVEVFNAKTSLARLNTQAVEFASELGLASGAGSDAHVPDAFGAAYVEIADFDSPAEFVAALHDGVVAGHYWDKHRPWRARVIPSTTAG